MSLGLDRALPSFSTHRKVRMNIHKNARLTPLRREAMALSVIEGALSQAQAARTYGVSAKVVARWVERFKVEGRATQD